MYPPIMLLDPDEQCLPITGRLVTCFIELSCIGSSNHKNSSSTSTRRGEVWSSTHLMTRPVTRGVLGGS